MRPARGNFYEVGFSKSVGGHFRLDGSWYRRDIRNFPDDSLLLNSGVSFPIAFSKGEVYGYEAKIDVPRWGPFSGFVSYANMVGRGLHRYPADLFLGDEADELLESRGSFPDHPGSAQYCPRAGPLSGASARLACVRRKVQQRIAG